MKKVLATALCFVLTAMFSTFAQAELPKHSVDLGTELSYIQYKEPGIMKEKGVMYGLIGSYTYHHYVMLKADGKIAYGKVDYDGQLSDGTPYTINNIDDYMLELRGTAGFDIPIMSSTLTPYLGIGYRYLNDDPSFDPAGYER
jgi:hypothetical protein